MPSTSYPNGRLVRDHSALVLVDHQVGLLLGVHDQDQEQLRRNVIALAEVAKTYQRSASNQRAARIGSA